MENTISDAEKAYLEQYIGENQLRLRQAVVEISSAEILAMNATPKELVPAPGAGKSLEFVSMVLAYHHGGTDYLTQGDLTAQTGTTGTALSDTVAGADLLLGGASASRVVQALSADEQLDENESLVLAVGTADPTAGDGTLKATVFYREHITAL